MFRGDMTKVIVMILHPHFTGSETIEPENKFGTFIYGSSQALQIFQQFAIAHFLPLTVVQYFSI